MTPSNPSKIIILTNDPPDMPDDRKQVCLGVCIEIRDMLHAKVRTGELTLREATEIIKSMVFAYHTANELFPDILDKNFGTLSDNEKETLE